MNNGLSFAEAINRFDPVDTTPPILAEPLFRVAVEAWRHLSKKWEQAQIDHLVRGLDRLYAAMETQDPILTSLVQSGEWLEAGDVTLLGFEQALHASLYRYFVCSAAPEAQLTDALFVHALGAASRVNAFAHQICDHGSPTPVDCEQLAGCAMYAQERLDTALLAANGVEFAEYKTRTQRRVAADARHSSAQEIKQRFVAFYWQGTFATKADAARKFFRSLSETEKRIVAPSLAEYNAVRTLSAALVQSSK